ncbi:TPA: glyoxalase [Staphylococcus aureus]|nr:glyoxalase [Staphylococcus aureus]HCZ0085484.1 glyoxalase [Staphylococcus aureus]
MEFYQMPMFNKVLMNHLRLEKYQDLMLISQKDFEVGNSIYLNILVKDIEEKSQNISQKFIVRQLEEQPWNAKEMTIKDPDGNLITLTQSNISDTDFEKLMKKTSKDY